jgi:hypothetical protein
MGRGRTTTGMIVASLIATIRQNDMSVEGADDLMEQEGDEDDVHASEATQYLMGKSISSTSGSRNLGEYKTILQLVTVLSHGKRAFSSPYTMVHVLTSKQKPSDLQIKRSIRWKESRTCGKPFTSTYFSAYTRVPAERSTASNSRQRLSRKVQPNTRPFPNRV